MKNFEQLTHYADRGLVNLVSIEAVPRSASTALSRALNEAEPNSVFVNEPFNRMKHDLEQASGHIVSAVEDCGRVDDDPVTIITKNMARNLSPELFEAWQEVSSRIIWCIKNPHTQIASLLLRVANDITIEPGADGISIDQLGDYLETASRHLESSAVSTNFSKTSWEAIGEHFESYVHTEEPIVVDSDRFSADPRRVLVAICTASGLTYHDGMVNDWQKGYINANTGYSSTLTEAQNAWTRDAATSIAVSDARPPTLALEQMPLPLQRHIQEVALPVYDLMLREAV